MSQNMKKAKLRLDRVALVIVMAIVAIALLFGIYKGVSFALGQVKTLFATESAQPVVDDSEKYLATVVLDPGHGGIDAGAKKGKVYEKNIALKTAQYIGNDLKKENIKVVYTRTKDAPLHEDKQTDLRMRAETSAKNKANYFVSIHVNDYDKGNDVSGFEIYTKDDNSQALATSIGSSIENLKYSKNRGLQDGGSLAVLRQNTVPAVLVELGYIRGKDYNYLSSDQKLERLGQAISDGILNMVRPKQ